MSSPNLNEYYINAYLADVSTAGQIYVPIPFGGTVTKIQSALNGAITVADAVLTPKIGGTAMTNGAITITQSGSAAGDVDESSPSAGNTVSAGDAVEIETNGGSTGAVAVMITLTIER